MVDIFILCLGILILLSILCCRIYRPTNEPFNTSNNDINNSCTHPYRQVIIFVIA